MKKLRIVGYAGRTLCEAIVDVDGEDFVYQASLPLFLPVISVSLLSLDKKHDRQLKSMVEKVQALVR